MAFVGDNCQISLGLTSVEFLVVHSQSHLSQFLDGSILRMEKSVFHVLPIWRLCPISLFLWSGRVGLLARSKTGLTIIGAAAGGAALDRAEGAMLLVRSVAVFNGEFNWEGFLKGEANVFLTFPRDVGVRPRPTRRGGAGVLIAIGVRTLAWDPTLAICRNGAVLVVVRSGVRKEDPESVVTGSMGVCDSRTGVAVVLVNGRNGVVEVGGSIDVLGRLGVLVGSSPKIAIALRLASSFMPPAGAPDPVVNPEVGNFEGVAKWALLSSAARCAPLVASLSENRSLTAAVADFEGPATAFPFPVVKLDIPVLAGGVA